MLCWRQHTSGSIVRIECTTTKETKISYDGDKMRLGFDPNYFDTFQDKLFIEGEQAARKYLNFFVLLLLATLIATYGLLSASTATVIGAMIVAPLMGPIMGTTGAVVLGQTQRALRAFALVIVGVLCVVVFSYLLALVVPTPTISFQDNPELISRINPGLFALLTALGAGAAGAFIVSRQELADSMGGVAIAISLVPPLCVVGIALRETEWNAAVGALLLFTTNLLAILFAGGLMLVLVGLTKFATQADYSKARRRGFALVIVATLLVAIPLAITSYQNIRQAIANETAQTELQLWLSGTPYRVVDVSVNGEQVKATVEGTGELQPVQTLADRLARALQSPVLVRLRVIPEAHSESAK